MPCQDTVQKYIETCGHYYTVKMGTLAVALPYTAAWKLSSGHNHVSYSPQAEEDVLPFAVVT